MKVVFILLALMTSNVVLSKSPALVVIKPVTQEKIILRIVRAIPDSFEAYSMTNHNGREMMLVCANNRVYDNNLKPIIEYRNFYNEIAGNFTIESNAVCLDMAKFIESAHYGIDEQRPFVITLNTKTMSVEKIVYPKIDPMSDSGDVKDLFPKKEVRVFTRPDGFRPQ
ncbi:MAG: hypothetical protein K2Q18_16660 [Bdellovibrionales bacterium]|nr:hypothetical protein [Bdellovibrionales bacterium]